MPTHPITDELKTARGEVRLSRPAWGIVHTVVVGYATIEIGERIIAWVDGAIRAHERPAVFHDWAGATGYEPRARPMFAEWYMRVRRDVTSVDVFTRSKVVAMGGALVSLATNNSIVAHRDRRRFEDKLQDALDARKGARFGAVR